MVALRVAAVAIAFVLCTEVLAASHVDVVEAVLPRWPKDEPLTQSGTVSVDFVLAPRGQVFVTDVTDGGLPKAFADEAVLAMFDWLIDDDASGGCGLIRGRQYFRFDGAAGEPVQLGETQARLSDSGAAVGSLLDDVEVIGGRIPRNQAIDPVALARHDSVEASYGRRREQRWKEARATTPRTPYSPPGIAAPIPWKRIEPRFPSSAIIEGRSGVVASRVSIDESGDVTKAEVVDSYPVGTFDQETRRALMRWKSTPAKDATGKPISIDACQVISFLVIEEGRFHQGKR